jgi:hypothetical protein
MPEPDPAVTVGTQDEARALRFAVRFALRAGLATDGLEPGETATNASLVSLAEKLGMEVPDEQRHA